MENGSYASVALVHFLFGIFCAYWAQTTNRNPWLWFFLGFFFAPITGLVLLHENSKEASHNADSEKKH
jgi:ABC-type multidrug transport system permease subunit